MTSSATPASSPSRVIIWLAYTAAFLGVCGHASSEFVVKLTALAGPEVTVWRFMLGGLALIIVSMLVPSSRDLWTPLKRDFVPIAGLSIFGMTVGQFFFHWALDFASVVEVATLVTTMPILVVFVAKVVDGTTIGKAKLFSGVGAFLGCVFLLSDGFANQANATDSNLIGLLMALGCAVIGALYLVLIKPYTGQYGAIRMTTYTFVLGFFAVWPVVGLVWGVWVNPLDLFARSASEAGAIIALGIWNTCIGFILWLWGLGNVPDVGRGNYLFFLKPVIATILAFFILGDHITWPQLLAVTAITGFVMAEIVYGEMRSKAAV